ncbi:MAG: DUF2087 domain-containing protein [Candidatus Edwardsbacteria bacterium]
MKFLTEFKKYLDEKDRVKVWPSKRKIKLLVLEYLASKFEEGLYYSEKEVNIILNEFHTFSDPCLLRRELYAYGFLARTKDTSKYWKIVSNLNFG